MSKRKITGKVLSVRLGRDETQIVLMGTNSEILHTATVETPAGAVEDGMIRNADAVHGMLKEALREPEFKRARKVIFTLCTSQVITETVTVPDLPPKKLEKLIRTNVDMYFPVDMKDYQMVWQVIGPKADSEELSVQLWAVPTAMVSRYYAVANACGLSLEAVDYCGHSIATAVGASFARPAKTADPAKAPKAKKGLYLRQKNAPEEEEKDERGYDSDTDLYVTLESDLLGMTFVQNGQVVMQRFIQCGSNPAYQYAELSMMLEYFRSLDVGRGSFLRGYLTGALSTYKDVTTELEDVLGLTLTPFSSSYDPRLCLCVGACHTTMEFGMPALNKPGKARREFQSQIWQYGLLLAGGLAVIFVVLLLLNSRLSWSSEISGLESTRQTLSIQAQQTNEYSTNYNNYVTVYDAYSDDWDTVFASLRTNNNNLVRIMEELEEIMPESCSVTQLQISNNGIVASFACETKEDAAYLIMVLRDMKYADLGPIVSLSGGGKGPATSYGSEEEEGEEAPTEGSVTLTDDQINTLVKLFAGSVDSGDILDVALTLSPKQIELIEDTYSKEPETQNNNIDAVNANMGDEVTVLARANAINDTLTTNYFAMYHFFNLLGEDIMRDDPFLWDVIDDEMLSEENSDIWAAITSGTVDDAKTLQNYTRRVVTILTRDEETIAATEELMRQHERMQQWYVYYLEEELGLHAHEAYPYLDVEKVIADLMNGSFNTPDTNANEKLNSLVPDAAWKMLALLNKGDEEEIKDLPGGLTEDEMIAIYKKYIAGEATAAQKQLAEEVNKRYLANDLKGYDKLKKLIADHLKNGQEEDEDYIIGSYTESDLRKLLDNLFSIGTTGSSQLDDSFKQMMAMICAGQSTGNSKLDNLLASYIKAYPNHPIVQEILASLSGGGSGGSGAGPTDTRTHFVVNLTYNEELWNAELERKGLSAEDKVEDTIQEKLAGGEEGK